VLLSHPALYFLPQYLMDAAIEAIGQRSSGGRGSTGNMGPGASGDLESLEEDDLAAQMVGNRGVEGQECEKKGCARTGRAPSEAHA
jgi:hypothetical protein